MSIKNAVLKPPEAKQRKKEGNKSSCSQIDKRNKIMMIF
jgi:hypothetical protein